MTEIGSEPPARLAFPTADTGIGSAGPGAGPSAGAGQVPGARGVEVALSPLGRLGDTPVSEHVGIFEEVLAGLEGMLASVDEPPSEAQR